MTGMRSVEQPLRVSGSEALQWDEEADVVVVGFGCAGAAAALEASEQGAEVLIVDRFEGGGATAYSGGIYYAGGTRYQRQNGFDDTPEEMFKYLRLEIRGAVRDETLRRFCEESSPTVDWLEKHGVRFNGEYYAGKSSYPPEDKYLYYSGNEKIKKYSDVAEPAPRGLRVQAKGWSGYAFFGALRQSVADSEIRTLTHSAARQFVVDDAGRVVGVGVESVPEPEQGKHQALYARVVPLKPFMFEKSNRAIAECEALERTVARRRFIRAKKGVVMATGGFAYNMDLLEKHLPNYAENAPALLRLGSAADSGSGHALIESAGGALGNMDRAFAGISISPPDALLRGIIVNRQGRRFVNEDCYSAFLGDSIADQPQGTAWLIFDGKAFWRVVRRLMPRGDGNFRVWYVPVLLNILMGGTRRARSIAKLAGKCGIDTQGLEEEIAGYNAMAGSGDSDPLQKQAAYVEPFRSGRSWYAINVSMSNPASFMLFFTLGGACVDEDSGAVVDDEGNVIDGLYAAGRAAVGIPSNGYYASGLSLADGIFSGRRAGRHCAVGTQQVNR